MVEEGRQSIPRAIEERNRSKAGRMARLKAAAKGKPEIELALSAAN